MKIHYSIKYKKWWRNMDNRTRNFLHMGEENYVRFLHLNERCRLDRVGIYPYIVEW